jgi:hypothetical protein
VATSSLLTNLLGRRIRFHEPPEGAQRKTGQIATVYVDGDGMHYVVLIDSRLIHVADGAAFTVLDDPDY